VNGRSVLATSTSDCIARRGSLLPPYMTNSHTAVSQRMLFSCQPPHEITNIPPQLSTLSPKSERGGMALILTFSYWTTWQVNATPYRGW
jgi:hypothetical protein